MIQVDEKGNEWLGWLEEDGEALAVFARLEPGKKKIDLNSIQVDEKLEKRFSLLTEKKWFVDELMQLDEVDLLPQVLLKALSREPSQKRQEVKVDNIPELLISEIDQIGWDHFVSVNHSLNVVKLKIKDDDGYDHTFDVEISQEYPFVPPILSVDIPVNIQLTAGEPESDKTFSFSHILRVVQREINNYRDLFKVLRDLDCNTKILEPSTRSFSVVSRRFAVSRTCSIKITLDPESPCDLCQVTYMGPQEEVSQLRLNFAKNSSKWSCSELVRINLQNMFETTFIEPSLEEDLSYLNECGICYSNQLNNSSIYGKLSAKRTDSCPNTRGKLSGVLPSPIDSTGPDQMCLNRKCGRLFHTECLVSWLQAVPTSKISFGTLFGNCPYCSESISVRTLR